MGVQKVRGTENETKGGRLIHYARKRPRNRVEREGADTEKRSRGEKIHVVTWREREREKRERETGRDTEKQRERET